MTVGGNTSSRVIQGVAGGDCTNTVKGETCTATDPNSNTTTFNYNSSHLVSQIVYPTVASPGAQLGSVSRTYDANNRIATITDGKGQINRYSYDNDDRITQILFNSTTTCDVPHATCIEYGYDPTGNQTSRKDNTGTTSFTFDLLNRPTNKTNTTTSEVDDANYDAVNSLTSIASNGKTVGYNYADPVPHVTSIHLPGVTGCGTGNINCILFSYNPNDAITSITYPNGVTTTVTCPSSAPTQSVTTGSFGTQTLTYTYFKPGSSVNDQQLLSTRQDGSNKTTYSYDTQNRLTDATTAAGATTISDFAYTYDNNSNITRATSTISGTTTIQSMAYNANNQLCWTYNAVTSNLCASKPTGATGYTYDANGNQLTGNHTATYNAKDQTTAIEHRHLHLRRRRPKPTTN